MNDYRGESRSPWQGKDKVLTRLLSARGSEWPGVEIIIPEVRIITRQTGIWNYNKANWIGGDIILWMEITTNWAWEGVGGDYNKYESSAF